MGNLFSLNPRLKYKDNTPGQNQVCRDVFTKLTLTDQDINKFYATYRAIGNNYSNDEDFVRQEELFAYFHMESTELNKKIFGIYGGNGHIDFLEFVCLMWNFLSTEPEELSLFAFCLFCDGTSMSMTTKQLDHMMQTIYGKTYLESSALKEVMSKILGNMKYEDSRCTKEDFNNVCQDHRSIVYPLLMIQLGLRTRFLGEAFWKDMSRRRYDQPNMIKNDFILDVSAEAVQHNEDLRSNNKPKPKRFRSLSNLEFKPNPKKISPVAGQRKKSADKRSPKRTEANRRRSDTFPDSAPKSNDNDKASTAFDIVEMLSAPEKHKREKAQSSGNAAEVFVTVEGESSGQRATGRSKDSPRNNSTSPRNRLNSRTSPRRGSLSPMGSPKSSPLNSPRRRASTPSPRQSPNESILSLTCANYTPGGSKLTMQEIED